MTSLPDTKLREYTARLEQLQQAFARHYPGEQGTRQPVHTVYGGAQLFKSDTTRKLGDLAVKALDQYAPEPHIFAEAIALDPRHAETVHARVRNKLQREAVEDFRIDFEDGYGIRPDAEEDGHAQAAAEECAKGLSQGSRRSSGSASRPSRPNWEGARCAPSTCSSARSPAGPGSCLQGSWSRCPRW
jgi:hypothetical protein